METEDQRNEGVSTTQVGLRYGLMVGLAAIIYGILLQITGLASVTGLQWLGGVITIVGMVLAMKYYKESNGGYMTFSQGLGVGTILAAVSGVLSSIFTLIYIRFIDDSQIQIAIEKAEEDLEARGFSDEQMEEAMEMTRMMTTPEAIFLSGILGSILIGFILALIIALFMKKDNPEFQ
ncbi:MAG: DUF4199 domain-containing protein [Bacteroidota bacterium]